MLGIANEWKDMQLAVLDSVANDPGIKERMLLLPLEELQTRPAETLEQLWEFCELDAETAAPITKKYADQVGPSPRRSLSDEDRAVLPRVWEIVAPVAQQLGYQEPDYEKDYA
jgi:hypothetical protein